jgi:hypothetical protein
MPDFVPVLVAAVLSLVVLLVAFGGSMFIPTGAGGHKESSKTIILGQNLVVMYIEGQKNVTSLGGEASQGIFGSSDQETGFTIDDYKDVSEGVIKLRTWNSNYYGNLFINVNGNQVFNGVPAIGEQTIIFDSSILRPNNTLQVQAESSGWKMWAPNVYIFNASLSVNYIGRTTQSLKFDLNSAESKGASRARLLVFGTRTGPGNLVATLNGNQIFSGFTTVYTDFAIDNLKEGQNTLDLSTEKNTIYNITSVQIVVFY